MHLPKNNIPAANSMNVSRVESSVLRSAIEQKTFWALVLAALVVLVATTTGHAQTESVLHSFANDGTDGFEPYATLIVDGKGNLYGTTSSGGAHNFGMVFKLTPTGTEKVLYSFGGGADGAHPQFGLVRKAGILYGVTPEGGAFGLGAVFKVNASGIETVLYSFKPDGVDGTGPNGDLVFDSAGNLYGTTQRGGAFGLGTVFKVTPTGAETVLHSFAGGTDGCIAKAGLIRAGTKLYGTTFGCGNSHGTVFQITLTGTETVLHNFSGPDGELPSGRLVRDPAGNLYGTTFWGGAHTVGTLFRVTKTGTHTVLYHFADIHGGHPSGALVLDSAGNLSGTTVQGGQFGAGTVFVVSPIGDELVLHSFPASGPDGRFPQGGVVLNKKNGSLYGTTLQGGSGNVFGAVFQIIP